MRVISETDKNGVFRHAEVFDSFGDFVTMAEENSSPSSSNKKNDLEWHGPKAGTLKSAAKLAHNGWRDLRPEVDAILNEVTERLAERLEHLYKPTYDFGGAYVDMGRFVEGDPECMVSFAATAENASGRVVKVVVAGTASASIRGEWLMRRGTAVLSLIDTINKLGYGVELWWDSTVTGSSPKERGTGSYTTLVKLHDSADTLDIDSVMFALAHPSMLRRLVFSIQEQSTYASEQRAYLGGGYGTPTDLGSLKFNDYDVVIEKLQNGYGDIINDPMNWVLTTLKGLEVIPEEA